MTLEGDLFSVTEWILDKSANTYYNFITANWCATHSIAHIPFIQDFQIVKYIFSKILNWRIVNGLSFGPFVVTFGLTKLAEVGDYSCSYTLITYSFDYRVWINIYLLQICAKSVTILLALLVDKQLFGLTIPYIAIMFWELFINSGTKKQVSHTLQLHKTSVIMHKKLLAVQYWKGIQIFDMRSYLNMLEVCWSSFTFHFGLLLANHTNSLYEDVILYISCYDPSQRTLPNQEIMEYGVCGTWVTYSCYNDYHVFDWHIAWVCQIVMKISFAQMQDSPFVKHFYMFQEVYAATMLISYLDFWYKEVFMVSVLALPLYWFYVWCGLVDMGHELVKMLREREGMRNLELTLGVTTLIQQLYLHFNLEDKVDFKGDGNVRINDALTSCLITNMLYIEGIICDIKVVEVEMMERIRHKKMLLSSSWSDALEFYHVQIMDSLEVDSLNSQIFLTEVVKKSIWTICNQFLISCAHFKQWDPGQHLEMCKTMWSFNFKQWDPGKICTKCSFFYNLEDKVGFKGDSIVMNPPNWIGPNKELFILSPRNVTVKK
ncbi:hypothetical protein QL285_076374 [Trifolium repens]|nr:hypothetical protein QL285_076374 [Trifolium repens]